MAVSPSVSGSSVVRRSPASMGRAELLYGSAPSSVSFAPLRVDDGGRQAGEGFAVPPHSNWYGMRFTGAAMAERVIALVVAAAVLTGAPAVAFGCPGGVEALCRPRRRRRPRRAAGDEAQDHLQHRTGAAVDAGRRRNRGGPTPRGLRSRSSSRTVSRCSKVQAVRSSSSPLRRSKPEIRKPPPPKRDAARATRHTRSRSRPSASRSTSR